MGISGAIVAAALFWRRWRNKSRRPRFFKTDDKSKKPGALVVGNFVVAADDVEKRIVEIGPLVVVAAKVVTGELLFFDGERVGADVVVACTDAKADCCFDNIVVEEIDAGYVELGGTGVVDMIGVPVVSGDLGVGDVKEGEYGVEIDVRNIIKEIYLLDMRHRQKNSS